MKALIIAALIVVGGIHFGGAVYDAGKVAAQTSELGQAIKARQAL